MEQDRASALFLHQPQLGGQPLVSLAVQFGIAVAMRVEQPVGRITARCRACSRRRHAFTLNKCCVRLRRHEFQRNLTG
jgi:hypothetical protein